MINKIILGIGSSFQYGNSSWTKRNYRTPEQFIKNFNENESKIKLGNENQITEVCRIVSHL